jgi:hypothetical protein
VSGEGAEAGYSVLLDIDSAAPSADNWLLQLLKSSQKPGASGSCL